MVMPVHLVLHVLRCKSWYCKSCPRIVGSAGGGCLSVDGQDTPQTALRWKPACCFLYVLALFVVLIS